MENTELHLALNQLRECISTRDDDEVEYVLMDLESATQELDRWPEDFLLFFSVIPFRL
jgi:hypothetical protein